MKIKNLFKFIVVVLMFFLLGSTFSSILKYIGIDVSLFDYKDYSYYELFLELLFAAVVYYLYRKCFRQDYKEIKNGIKDYLNTILKFFALFMAIKIFSAILTSVVSLIIGVQIGESENQEAIVKITSASPLLMLMSTVVLAPIVEEGIFRLGLRKVINNKYIFVIVSGLIFGFMHIFPTDLSMSVALTYSITYVTMGVCLAYIYTETDNIWVCILIHAINNLLSMLFIIFVA